jgi:hypothetical protein
MHVTGWSVAVTMAIFRRRDGDLVHRLPAPLSATPKPLLALTDGAL